MEFLFNDTHEVLIEPYSTIHLLKGDKFENDHITYIARENGFYRFTGVFFFFLFP